MTVRQLSLELELEPINEAEPDREITGGYTGDLLSWVMGRADQGHVWVTIMTNINIAAVATLADVSAIVLAEGVRPEQDVINTAREHGINIYSSPLDSFELCGRIYALL